LIRTVEFYEWLAGSRRSKPFAHEVTGVIEAKLIVTGFRGSAQA